MSRSLSAVLGLDDYYEQDIRQFNRDAFDEDLESIAIPEDSGMVLAFAHYSRFVQTSRRVAQDLLDSIAVASRYHLLFGNRLLALVQSDSKSLHFKDVGALAVIENP